MQEAIPIEVCKAHLKVDYDFEDDLIKTYLEGIVYRVEEANGLAIIPNQTVSFELLQWSDRVAFPVNPAISIESVEINGEAVSDFEVLGQGFNKYIQLNNQGRGVLKVEYTAGTGANPDMKNNLLEMLAIAYEYRDSSKATQTDAWKRMAKYRSYAY